MLKIYNTLSREKALFQPLVPGQVGLYVCGMTVYDYCHLGHARVMVAFDMVVRYLRYRGYEVRYVRNITDVDDKIIQRAQANGESFSALAERFIHEMHVDFAALGVEAPTSEPRATCHIDGMLKLIATLIEKGVAYVGQSGDVYFRVAHFADYGKLSGKVLDDLRAGERVEVSEDKEDPLDFVLWKAAKPGEPSWPSPWGEGRPGWHIECSAMSMSELGQHFDIHGGGPDLKFPHHENEIAQSESATGQTYANVWMHAGAVRVDGEKMSKSLGNFFTIREVLTHYHAEVVRFFLLSSHYRSPINYADASLREAAGRLERMYQVLVDAPAMQNHAVDPEDPVYARFVQAMDDDFNTPEAIAVLFELVREINKSEGEKRARKQRLLRHLGGVLGILCAEPEAILQGQNIDAEWVEKQIEDRNEARRNRDFAEADRIRDALLEKGVELMDGREGTRWRRIYD